MPFPVLAAVAIGATLLSTYQRYQADKAQAQALSKKSKLLNIQAQEVLSREQENRKFVIREGREVLGQQQATLAKLGIQATEGSSLSEMEYSLGILTDELVKNRREALYEARAIRSEAQFSRQQGRDLRGAMGVTAAGSLLGGGFDAAVASGWRG